MLVPMDQLLQQAKREHKAVGAFNTTTLESIRGVIRAAQELQCPVILQHAQSHEHLISLEEIAPLLLHYARRASVPVAVHLDHGQDFDYCIRALRLGFTSLMYDASSLDFETNRDQTAALAAIAHAAGVSIEAELGHVFTSPVSLKENGSADQADTSKDPDAIYTNPADAKHFVESTGADCLAIAFGTVHGVYLKQPKLDFQRVAAIRDAVSVPLVMHGGSGISDEDYRLAIQNGICKINYYTYMNAAGANAAKNYWNNPNAHLFYDQMSLDATDAIYQNVFHALRVFQNL